MRLGALEPGVGGLEFHERSSLALTAPVGRGRKTGVGLGANNERAHRAARRFRAHGGAPPVQVRSALPC